MQSSSVLSDFTKKLLNFENVSPTDNEVTSLMDTGNGYLRKGQKSKPKRQNQARERKERKRKVKSKLKVNKKSKSNQVKVNPGKWIWKEHRKPNLKS
ncbi:hypothetical protein Tco_0625896 [Tanacetum coccineum]|uniref:Uncharacterized protein n=1 Tax=Tanacetum coccineum TaxID=301880 RepID=A0ABQ4WI44_9ASTR